MRMSTVRSASSAFAWTSLPARARVRDLVREALLRDGELEQLLLVHLERAVAAAERHAPLAVADELDLVVARLLDVELEQHVLVVADARGLHLGETLAHELGHLRRVGEDALALAATAADRLDAEAAAGVLLDDLLGLETQRLAELFDRVEVDALRVDAASTASATAARSSASFASAGTSRPLSAATFARAARSFVLTEHRAHGAVVDAGRDGDVRLERGALGFVLLAGRALREAAGAHERQARVLDAADELFVLGHEAVAREDVVVAVCLADARDLVHPLDALFLRRARVVGDGGARASGSIMRSSGASARGYTMLSLLARAGCRCSSCPSRGRRRSLPCGWGRGRR
jgi:hypothetical protein